MHWAGAVRTVHSVPRTPMAMAVVAHLRLHQRRIVSARTEESPRPNRFGGEPNMMYARPPLASGRLGLPQGGEYALGTG